MGRRSRGQEKGELPSGADPPALQETVARRGRRSHVGAVDRPAQRHEAFRLARELAQIGQGRAPFRELAAQSREPFAQVGRQGVERTIVLQLDERPSFQQALAEIAEILLAPSERIEQGGGNEGRRVGEGLLRLVLSVEMAPRRSRFAHENPRAQPSCGKGQSAGEADEAGQKGLQFRVARGGILGGGGGELRPGLSARRRDDGEEGHGQARRAEAFLGQGLQDVELGSHRLPAGHGPFRQIEIGQVQGRAPPGRDQGGAGRRGEGGKGRGRGRGGREGRRLSPRPSPSFFRQQGQSTSSRAFASRAEVSRRMRASSSPQSVTARLIPATRGDGPPRRRGRRRRGRRRRRRRRGVGGRSRRP